MWKKTAAELREVLSAPFPSADIEWRVSATNHEKTSGLAVPYVTNRAIQTRLDDTVGIDGWHNDFVPWKGDKAQLCGISIFIPELNDWLTKWDGSDDTDIESVKGGLSDSMKRAAVEWGVGRYLYGMTPPIWVSIEQRGKGYVIRDSERVKLDTAHDKWVQAIQQRKASGTEESQTVLASQKQGPQGQVYPVQGTASVAQPTGQPPAPSVQGNNAVGDQIPAQAQAGGIPDQCYMVTGAVLKPTMSGGSRTSVQIRNGKGQSLQAFTRGADPRLAPGLMLKNAQFSTQHANGVTFYILESYQIVDIEEQQAA